MFLSNIIRQKQVTFLKRLDNFYLLTFIFNLVKNKTLISVYPYFFFNRRNYLTYKQVYSPTGHSLCILKFHFGLNL